MVARSKRSRIFLRAKSRRLKEWPLNSIYWDRDKRRPEFDNGGLSSAEMPDTEFQNGYLAGRSAPIVGVRDDQPEHFQPEHLLTETGAIAHRAAGFGGLPRSAPKEATRRSHHHRIRAASPVGQGEQVSVRGPIVAAPEGPSRGFLSGGRGASRYPASRAADGAVRKPSRGMTPTPKAPCCFLIPSERRTLRHRDN